MAGQIAADSFGRSVPQGWGTADVGGSWSMVSGASVTALSVTDGAGRVTPAPGGTYRLDLPETSAVDASAATTYSISTEPSTGAVYAGVMLRQAGTERYLVLAWHRDNGSVWLVIQRSGILLQTAAVAGVTWAAGEAFQITGEVVSSGGSSTLRAKMWKAGTAEPEWQLEAADSTEDMQRGGTVGVHMSRAASSTSDTTLSFTQFTAYSYDTAPPGPGTPPQPVLAGYSVLAADGTLIPAVSVGVWNGLVVVPMAARPVAWLPAPQVTDNQDGMLTLTGGYWDTDDGFVTIPSATDNFDGSAEIGE